MKSLNLDALDAAQHTVEKDGVIYLVRQVTPRITTILRAAVAASAEEKAALYYDAVAKLIPSMPREEVDDLTPTQVLAIIELASTEADAVQEAVADPNAASSAPARDLPVTEPTPPASPAPVTT